ncbi:hypothetical protein [Streptomyces sp. NPDC088350]|uniref:hypothetical protein n=1 Tax=Streptomyces sp. NPDC088350 TaxID=3365854 RepID=UPI0038117239
MHGFTELGWLAGCFVGGRIYQRMRDRKALKANRTMTAAFDAVADIAAQRRRAESRITRETRKRG